MRVRDVMTHDPICCIPKTSVMSAVGMMRRFDIGLLLVIDDVWTRKLVGVVTDRDLCLSMLAEPHDPALAMVDDYMRKDLVTCTPDMDVREALALLSSHQIHRLPVVDQENCVRGVIGISDLIHNNAFDPRDMWMALSRITEPRAKEVRAKAA